MSSVPTPAPTPTQGPVGHQGVRVEIAQRPALALNGWFGVIVVAACGVAIAYLVTNDNTGLLWLPILVAALVLSALVVVPPGQTQVVQFFGRYVGTVSRPGFWWVLPLTVRRQVSIRVRNFETSRLKVNDADGNPVEIAAIVVWQVADTARSTYAVDDYVNFVTVQAESALRHVANTHPYDVAEGVGHVAARRDRRRGRRAGGARWPSASRWRRRDRRGADLAPRLRAGDRPGDAASPAGQRRRRRPQPDRRGRRRHGRDGPRPAAPSTTSWSSTRSARPRW